jgi:peptidoglycan DL-endopeptidase CwlO
VNGYPQWGPPRWGPPMGRSGPPLGALLLVAVVVVFLYGWRLAPAAGRMWADLQAGHAPFSLQLPKVALPKLPTLPTPGRPRPAPGTAARAAVAYARGQLGKPYVWGANGPGSFDCSGLTFRAWQAAGLGWGDMTAAAQYAWLRQRGAAVSGPPQPGDLVFYDPGDVHHAAIVAGPGVMIEAPGQGEPIRQVPIHGGYLAARPGLVRR